MLVPGRVLPRSSQFSPVILFLLIEQRFPVTLSCFLTPFPALPQPVREFLSIGLLFNGPLEVSVPRPFRVFFPPEKL